MVVSSLIVSGIAVPDTPRGQTIGMVALFPIGGTKKRSVSRIGFSAIYSGWGTWVGTRHRGDKR